METGPSVDLKWLCTLQPAHYRVSLVVSLMLRDFDVCFLPLVTAVSLKVTQENSQCCLFTHHTCDCACFFQLICGTMSYTAATINEALWPHASLCLRRRVPLASG